MNQQVAELGNTDRITYELRGCPWCGSPRSHVKLTGNDNMLGLDGLFYVSQCDNCGLLFQNPSLERKLLLRHYPEQYAPYVSQEMRVGRSALWYLKNQKEYAHLPEQPTLNWLRRRWGKWSAGTRLLPNYVPDGSLCEIGCASGARLSMMQRLGWNNLAGIEWGERAARLARERGFIVHAGRVEDALDRLPLRWLLPAS